jgi:hypothetical protein
MLKKLFTYTPTEQEQQFIDVINELLENKGTILKMTPVSNKYFIINEEKHYYILLKECGIQITNTKFSISKILNSKAYDIIIKNIHSHIEKDRQNLENILFSNEKIILSNILENLEK